MTSRRRKNSIKFCDSIGLEVATLRPNIGLNVATLRPMFGLEVATTLRPDDVEARYVWVTTPKKEWAAGNISIVQTFKKCNRFQNGKKSHHGNGNYKLFYSDCILRIPFQLLTNLLYK